MTGPAPEAIAAAMAAIRAEVAAPRDAAPDVAAPPPAEVAPSAAAPPDAAPALPANLDDTVRALLAPLLRDWLDAHLPEIVEAATRAEIARLTGLAGGDARGVDNPPRLA